MAALKPLSYLLSLNGPCDVNRSLKETLRRRRFAAVLGVDGGANILHALRIVPDVVIGDFDSLGTRAKQWLGQNEVEMRVHPTDKDDTDLELALRWLRFLHPDARPAELTLVGALGGRVDHTLANLAVLASTGWRVELLPGRKGDPLGWILCGRQQVTLEGRPNDLVSLIPQTRTVRVLSTVGLSYPLKNEVLSRNKGRGVSNRLSKARAHLRLEKGALLVLHYREASAGS